MKIMVTGGAGFIGANFLNWIVPKYPEHEFLNIDKLTYAGNLLSLTEIETAANYRFERIDLVDRGVLFAAVEQFDPDRVVHFAAETHVDRSIADPGVFVSTNVVGTHYLLEACRTVWDGRSDRLLHHVSTDEVFGALGDTGYFTEESCYDPSSPYAASKASADHLVRAYHKTFGLPVKITNCSNNYGPYMFPEKFIPLMILNAVDGLPLPIYGAGDNVRDWLYVTDHCKAIWEVIERGKVGETYAVGGECEKTNLDLIRTLCRVVAEETGKERREIESLITFVADRPGHDHRYAIDSSKIRNELGWKPRESFETGLRKTVRWYLDNVEWVRQVRSGEYRAWIETNYGDRPRFVNSHESQATGRT